jgi:hypothetical protein
VRACACAGVRAGVCARVRVQACGRACARVCVCRRAGGRVRACACAGVRAGVCARDTSPLRACQDGFEARATPQGAVPDAPAARWGAT